MQTNLTYQFAGVDITAGNHLVDKIKALNPKHPQVLSGIGGFNALFELPIQDYHQPVLVSSTDGVGTKLRLAISQGQHQGIGIDLVAMCVNDIITCGAKPLFFLDYYATGKLEVTHASQIILGIIEGCNQAGIALIGGETAEMPGMYHDSDYDIAGFSVGIVEKAKIIDGKKVKPSTALIGIASSGVHANGYSLVRKILEINQIKLNQVLAGKTLQEILLEPTKIYVSAIQQLIANVEILALAHITGGGIVENLPRVLPSYHKAVINSQAWPRPDIFTWLQTQGKLTDSEMWRTFNCGIGMIFCIAQDQVSTALDLLHTAGEQAWQIGEIRTCNQALAQVEIR